MQQHIKNKVYHVEILPVKQDSDDFEADLDLFAQKYNRVLENGYCACLSDNAMGHLAFQGTEVIEELGLEVRPEQIMIHLNTFHTKENLHSILDSCKSLGIKYLLVVSGDGSERLHRLTPSDIEAEGLIKTVTSVELLRYIKEKYPDSFTLGVAFNPYEPAEFEFDKLQKKLDAGAEFIVTQPIIERNVIIDQLLERYPEVPVIVEAWMSKKINLLSEAVGTEISADPHFDPFKTLEMLHDAYPSCGVCLSLLGFKTQFHLVKDTWI